MLRKYGALEKEKNLIKFILRENHLLEVRMTPDLAKTLIKLIKLVRSTIT